MTAKTPEVKTSTLASDAPSLRATTAITHRTSDPTNTAITPPTGAAAAGVAAPAAGCGAAPAAAHGSSGPQVGHSRYPGAHETPQPTQRIALRSLLKPSAAASPRARRGRP